jgi:ribosome-binding protein aMBF1 (putative translation factor)
MQLSMNETKTSSVWSSEEDSRLVKKLIYIANNWNILCPPPLPKTKEKSKKVARQSVNKPKKPKSKRKSKQKLRPTKQPTKNPETFQMLIKKAREAKGYTPEQLTKAIQCGRTGVYRYESSKEKTLPVLINKRGKPTILARIAAFLEIDLIPFVSGNVDQRRIKSLKTKMTTLSCDGCGCKFQRPTRLHNNRLRRGITSYFCSKKCLDRTNKKRWKQTPCFQRSQKIRTITEHQAPPMPEQH